MPTTGKDGQTNAQRLAETSRVLEKKLCEMWLVRARCLADVEAWLPATAHSSSLTQATRLLSGNQHLQSLLLTLVSYTRQMRSATAIVGSLSLAPSHEEIVAITQGIAGRKGEDCRALLATHTSSGRLNRKVTNRAHALKHRYRRRWIMEQQLLLLSSVEALRSMWACLHAQTAVAMKVAMNPADDTMFESEGGLHLGGMTLPMGVVARGAAPSRFGIDKSVVEVVRTALRTMAASVAAEAVAGSTLAGLPATYAHIGVGDAPGRGDLASPGGLLAWMQARPTSLATMMLLPPSTLDAAPSLTDKMHMLSALGTCALLDATAAFLPVCRGVDPSTPTVDPAQLQGILTLHANAQLDVSSVLRALHPRSIPQHGMNPAAVAAAAGVPVPGLRTPLPPHGAAHYLPTSQGYAMQPMHQYSPAPAVAGYSPLPGGPYHHAPAPPRTWVGAVGGHKRPRGPPPSAWETVQALPPSPPAKRPAGHSPKSMDLLAAACMDMERDLASGKARTVSDMDPACSSRGGSPLMCNGPSPTLLGAGQTRAAFSHPPPAPAAWVLTTPGASPGLPPVRPRAVPAAAPLTAACTV